MNYFENIKDTEIIYYIYRYWAPPLITIIVGGAFASIIWPRLQDRYIVKKKNAERFAEISEAILRDVPELCGVLATSHSDRYCRSSGARSR